MVALKVSPHLTNVRLHISVLTYQMSGFTYQSSHTKLQASLISPHVSISIFTYHVSHPSHIHSQLVSHAQNTQFHQSDGCMKTCDFNSRQHFAYVPLSLCVQRPPYSEVLWLRINHLRRTWSGWHPLQAVSRLLLVAPLDYFLGIILLYLPLERVLINYRLRTCRRTDD